MNVSMQDAFNLGWKLAAVLQGRSPAELLKTYNSERQAIARELIEFDKEWAAMLSAPLKSETNPDGVDPADVQAYFTKSGRYTAGTATYYTQSLLTGRSTSQDLARGFPIGYRFHSAPALRVADAKPVQLGHAALADGRWRLYVFADAQNPQEDGSKVAALCDFLVHSPQSPIVRFTPKGGDIDSVIDVRAVVQQSHRDVRLQGMPGLLLPRKGRYGLIDYEKLFSADTEAGENIFEMREIDRASGCIVIVRPDQYVAHVLALDAFDELSDFFAGFMLDQA